MQKFKYEPVFFTFVVIAAFFRFSYLGFNYTPYLDDYIQYYYYPTFSQPNTELFFSGAKIIFSRPLAVLFDFYFWSSFKNQLGIAVAILSVLHGLSGVLLYKAFKLLKINLGIIFFVFFLFPIINVEGTYWLSASTRIVFSMFFISLSTYIFANNKIIIYSVLNMLSLWFYEQTAILSLTLSVIFCFESKRYKFILIPILNFAALIAFYAFLGKTGDNAERMQIINPVMFIPHTLKILGEFTRLITGFSAQLTAVAFVRSVNIFFRDNSLFWFVCCGLICILVVLLADSGSQSFAKTKLVYGLVLAIAPLMPFVFTDSNALNLRNITPSLLGIALILDSLIPPVLKNLTPIIASICLIVFSVSAVSEICDYQKTAKHDFELAQAILMDSAGNSNEITVKITAPQYLEQNAVYNDHIKSMVASDWGLTGIARTISGNRQLKIIMEK